MAAMVQLVRRRRLIERFAAHLARLLNAGTDTTDLDLSAIYVTLITTLGRRAYQPLTGAGIVRPDRTSEEAAQAFFDAVLARRLFLKNNQTTHKGHELFLTLCQRGVAEGWVTANLKRETSRPGHPFGAPSDFVSTAGRLAAFGTLISAGNPAANTRARRGPLFLAIRQARAEIPEELPIWHAIKSAPLNLKKLSEGPAFDGFCSLAIKAVETANRPFAAILSLGLSPADWGDVLTVNTARALGRFLRELRKKKERGDGVSVDQLEAWRQAWEHCRVPGYPSAEALWESDIGRALRSPLLPQHVAFDDTLADQVSDEGEMLERASFEQQLRAARAAGVVDDFDVWLFTEVRAGATLAALETTTQVKARSGEIGDLATYLEALSERVCDWARSQWEDAESPHPDKELIEAEED